jgi:hypothetical protein
LEKRKGIKNIREIGTPTKILFAKLTVLSISLCSTYEKRIVIRLTNGRETIKPANIGFLKDNQLAKDNIMAEKITLTRNSNSLTKKIFNF